MRKIIPGEIPTSDLHQFLLASVAPRPIAFVSTINDDGVNNLAPYSFFNAFSSNPPILVFSSNRRVSDNTTKDTLANVVAQGECVINVVNHSIVRQMAISAVTFPTEVSEFEKSGLTPIASEFVKASRVKESPVQMECKVKDIITLGEHGGAGHLVICEVLAMHIDENIIDPANDRIDPDKIDLMGRMGRAYYVRASGAAIQTIYQSVVEIPIGYDGLPNHLKGSTILSANDVASLAGMLKLPEEALISEIKSQQDSDQITNIHQKIKAHIEAGEKEKALALAMAF